MNPLDSMTTLLSILSALDSWTEFEWIPGSEILLVQGHLGLPLVCSRDWFQEARLLLASHPNDKSLLYVLLMTAPNHYHYHNRFKKCLCVDFSLADDDFVNRLLHTYPKSSLLWSLKTWITLKFDLEWNLDVQEEAADKYFCNYPSWVYRLQFWRHSGYKCPEKEWERIKAWLWKHPNDHSGLHYFSMVLEKSPNLSKTEGIQFLHSMNDLYPGHESLTNLLKRLNGSV